MESCGYLSYQPNVESDLLILRLPCYKPCCFLTDLPILLLYTESYYCLFIHSFLLQIYTWGLSYVKLSAMDWSTMGHPPALKRLMVCKGSQATKQINSTHNERCYDIRMFRGAV